MTDFECHNSSHACDLIGDGLSNAALLRNICPENITVDNLEDTLKRAASLLSSHTDADHFYILVKNRRGELADVVSGDTLEDFPLTAISRSLVQRTLSENKSIAVDGEEFRADPDFQNSHIEKIICAFIGTQNSSYGVIYADSICKDRLGRDVFDLLDIAGYHIALAMGGMAKRRMITAGKATLMLSHSIKNLLQMVGGASEVIDLGLKSGQMDRVERSWEILKPNLARIRKFMLDMLDYSKERKLEVGPCEFNSIIQTATETFNSQLTNKRCKLNINVDDDIPVVEMDGDRIHEMALNLILNAIDAVDEKTGRVNIETNYLPEKNSVELIVTDNGPGMSAGVMEKIFEPFESGKNKLGTGLGMPIAKQTVDQHKGTIKIESKPGKGAKFTVVLPVRISRQ